MQLETNQISRDWTILHNGRKFYVNYTESDGQTLALCNRNNWEVWEETDDGVEELNEYVFKGDTAEEQKKAEGNSLLKERLIRFCIENWDGQFMQEIKEKLQGQNELLGGILND
jgi:hypothetical protein